MKSDERQNRLVMYSKGVHIRAFRSEDQKATRELVLAGLKDHFGWVDYARNPDLDDITRYYVRAGHIFVVAEEGQDIVGTGALQIAGEAGSMVRVSVTSQRRRKGIGSALVMHLLARATQRGLKQVTIVTNSDWVDAVALYKRCGFAEYARDLANVFLRRQPAAECDEAPANRMGENGDNLNPSADEATKFP